MQCVRPQKKKGADSSGKWKHDMADEPEGAPASKQGARDTDEAWELEFQRAMEVRRAPFV